ncbi:MAG TPA: ATP-dependent RecD-like DNA helicase [Chloroflexota bacterium]|nr:ATP-dependent RecD-like DNA helicase [Chloroflexota bacterium]
MPELRGSVERIVFRNPDTGYCVARLQPSDLTIDRTGLVTIVGSMPAVRTGEMLRLTGEWQVHPTHGRNFRVERFEEELPTTVEGIERYLASGSIRGVGPVTAARIVERFGERSIVVIDEDPHLLRDVAGISAKRLEAIKASWTEQKKVRELSLFLQEHGISVALAQRIFDAYGDEAPTVIRDDPYRLAHEIHGIGFRTADAIAQQLGMSKRSLPRYVAGLKYALSQATEDGHVFLTRPVLLTQAARVLDAVIPELEPALLELVHRGDAVADNDAIYLTPFYRAENGAARLLQALRRAQSAVTMDPRFDVKAAVTRAAGLQGLALAEMQLRAAEQALSQKVSILTGGPGTGKTATLRTIITALEGAEISYCLCAPTGRAAKRAAEATGRSASTIHRLLEYQPGANVFGRDNARPLPHDFVVVDEVSMLDLLLFYHLLKAIPRESHLLLVGDADQLPAVGPGNVLQDLLESRQIPCVTLTELFRQAADSQIVRAAHAVNQGRVPGRADSGRDFFFVPAENDDDAAEMILRLVQERIPSRFGLDPVDDIQVVSPMHNGSVGVTALNLALQRRLNPASSASPQLERGGRVLRLGDKVMQVRNNYDKDVYNGDVGRVISVNPTEQAATVAFGTGSVVVNVEYGAMELDELVLAYAVSVHKAQGSEFPALVMPVTTSHYVLLRRNLLYTAISRARRLCVLVGSQRSLSVAVSADRRESRNSRLAQRVAATDALQLELV